MNHRDRDNGRAIPPATENYAPILSLLTDAPFIIFALQIFVHPFFARTDETVSRLPARAFQSRCQVHRKRESPHRVSG